jgi:ABC-2 type transport system permease protein
MEGAVLSASFYTLIRREVARFMKVAVQTLALPMVNSTLYLLIFGVSLGQHIQLPSGTTYLAFLIPGLVMMGVLNNSFQNSSSSIINAKFSGDIEDFKVAPLSSKEIIWALGFGGVIRGFAVGFITWVVGVFFLRVYEGYWLGVEHPVWLFFFLFVGSLAFSFLGMSAAFWAKNFDQIAAVGGFILLPLIYLGGVFFSLETLHPFWQGVARMNPLLYYINGVRFGVLGVADVDPWRSSFVSLASLVFFFGVAYWSLVKGRFTRW